jgi:hypothetical protein
MAAIRIGRAVKADLEQSRSDMAAHLSRLEVDGHGRSRLACSLRDYVKAADRVLAEMRVEQAK